MSDLGIVNSRLLSERVLRVERMFCKKRKYEKVNISTTKVIDKFLIASCMPAIREFLKRLDNCFKLP